MDQETQPIGKLLCTHPCGYHAAMDQATQPTGKFLTRRFESKFRAGTRTGGSWQLAGGSLRPLNTHKTTPPWGSGHFVRLWARGP